jgi:hypothetical protein
MNRKLFAAAVSVASALAALTVGCQTYDFQPVEPLALIQEGQYRDLTVDRIRPNIMLVVDKSGSMNRPADPSLPGCQVPAPGGGTATCPQGATLCNPAQCPTRWSELQRAMNTFFGDSANQQLARFGVATYPNNSLCGTAGAPSTLRANIPQTDEAQAVVDAALSVNQIIQGISMVPSGSTNEGRDDSTGGGTPTGDSLAQIGALAELADAARDDVILLLTDGLPNCNPNNPNDQDVNAAQCKCTLGGGGGCIEQPPPNDLSKLGCLDRDETVRKIEELVAQKGIRTAVIGLGSETGSGDGPVVLNAMADAGGLERSCPKGTDAECGAGNSCDLATRTCVTRYYQAGNATELSAAIAQIGAQVTATDECHYKLKEAPESQDFVSVLVGPSGGTLIRQAPGNDTWRLELSANLVPPCVGDVPCVVLQGALCAEVKASTETSDPYRVEVRALYPL